VLIGAEPGFAAVEPAADVALVVVEDYVLALDAARELRRGNFYLGGFVNGDAGVGDCDSPSSADLKSRGGATAFT